MRNDLPLGARRGRHTMDTSVSTHADTGSPPHGKEEILSLIEDIIRRIAAERDYELPEISLETRLLGATLPLDSLDLAVVIVELQQRTGRDPFKNGFIEFQTIGELVKLYAG